MKRLEAFYPPLAAAFPVLAVFSANLSICPLQDLWRPLAVAIGVALALWAVAAALCRSISRGAAAATVVVITTFFYAPWENHCFRSGTLYPLGWWIAVTVLLAGLAAWVWKWHRLLNIVAACLVVTSTASIFLGYGRIARDEARMAHAAAEAGSTGAARPDIYYVILDGYGRQDQLERVMRFDNSPFIAELEKRGFWVAPASHSNYVQTELSLSSSLNMDFLPALLPDQPRSSEDRSPLDELASRNAVARYLHGIGYEYIAITSGFPSLQFNSADLKLGAPHRISLLESALLAMTPVGAGTDVLDSMFEERRQLLRAAFSNLQTVAAQAAVKPRFVFVHVLAPHPPFVFNADGSARPKGHGSFGYWDGSDFMNLGQSKEDYRNGYVAQLQFVNTETLAVLDAIYSKPGPRPIILIQGDHGSKLGLNQDSIVGTDLNECMSNLMAYEVPPEVHAKLYPTITPVNSFRILLSTLFGLKLPNLPDRSWYSPFHRPYEYTEVTDRLKPEPAKVRK